MKEIIEWLLSIERLSNGLYRESARHFSDDVSFAEFLSHLAADELWHYEVMRTAIHEAGLEGSPVSAIALDQETKERIEGPFRENISALTHGSLTKETVFECVVRTEFSEWNDIFLYVVNSLKDRRKDFLHVAAQMQQHKAYIESYLDHMSVTHPLVSKLRGIPPVWKARMLVIDDYHPIREFLSAVLSEKGIIDEAVNGKEGLSRLDSNRYDVIVTDVDMPVMNGWEMFHSAERRFPGIGSRIIFLSGTPDSDEVHSIRERGLRFLEKPVLISEIEAAVRDVLKENVTSERRNSAAVRESSPPSVT
jgi:two-component system chemotaxis response regulator CheY